MTIIAGINSNSELCAVDKSNYLPVTTFPPSRTYLKNATKQQVKAYEKFLITYYNHAPRNSADYQRLENFNPAELAGYTEAMEAFTELFNQQEIIAKLMPAFELLEQAEDLQLRALNLEQMASEQAKCDLAEELELD